MVAIRSNPDASPFYAPLRAQGISTCPSSPWPIVPRTSLTMLRSISIFLILLAIPVAQPHYALHKGEIPGNLDTHCEDTAQEITDHDYGLPAHGAILFGFVDGNREDCDGDFDETDPFCWVEEVAREDVDDDTHTCQRFDYDGHSEYAQGGAWLLVQTGDDSGGSMACFGEVGHHPTFGPFHVVDLTLGTSVPFLVAADHTNGIGAMSRDCGDAIEDVYAICTGGCHVSFSPGLDGAYHVYVGDGTSGQLGTQGHVCSPHCPPLVPFQPTPPSDAAILGECFDFVDNDGDGGADWFDTWGLLFEFPVDDSGCTEGVAGSPVLDGDGER